MALLIHPACLARRKTIVLFLIKPLEDIPEDLRFLERQEEVVEEADQEADQVLVVDRGVLTLCHRKKNPRLSFILGQRQL